MKPFLKRRKVIFIAIWIVSMIGVFISLASFIALPEYLIVKVSFREQYNLMNKILYFTIFFILSLFISIFSLDRRYRNFLEQLLISNLIIVIIHLMIILKNLNF